jgi:diaminopimelate decarboxylase
VSAIAERRPAGGVSEIATRHPHVAVGARVAGLDPEALAASYGSPLFVYDLDTLTARVSLLRAALPRAINLAFAVKANPCLAVLAHLAGLGVGADVASSGELDAAVRAGVPVDRIVFTGPGKTDAELGRAVRLGIRALTIESLDELDVVIELAELARPNQGLLLRLAIEGSIEDRPIIGGAGAAKFGLLPGEVDEAIDRLHRSGAIGGRCAPFRLLGLHAFGASNVLDPAAISQGVRRLAARAEEVGRFHGLPIALLDGGGGLGLAYRDDQAELDLAELGGHLEREIATWPSRGPLAGATLLLEPGRFLSGPIGAFVIRVIRTKRRSRRTIAVVDGGIHHLLRPNLVGQAHRVVAVGATAARPPEGLVDVVGPLCTGLDVLAGAVSLPEPRSGDLLAILDAGAYGFTESMPYFLSHPQPAEVVVSRGRAHLARPRLDPGEWLSRQSPRALEEAP